MKKSDRYSLGADIFLTGGVILVGLDGSNFGILILFVMTLLWILLSWLAQKKGVKI